MEDGSQFSDEAGSGSFMAMDEANLQSGPPPHARPALPPHAASLTPLGAADDMVNLGDLHEAALLHNLRIRFFADDIFTHIGPILVACNPYKRLPIFTPAVINVRAARRTAPPVRSAECAAVSAGVCATGAGAADAAARVRAGK